MRMELTRPLSIGFINMLEAVRNGQEPWRLNGTDLPDWFQSHIPPTAGVVSDRRQLDAWTTFLGRLEIEPNVNTTPLRGVSL